MLIISMMGEVHEKERIKEGNLNPELSGELAVDGVEIDKVSAKEILSEI